MNGILDARAALFPDGEPRMTWDRWCRLAPRLMDREAEERDAILSEAKIDPDEWTRANGYWSLTLAGECARGDRARADVFGQACAQELASRRRAPEPQAVAPAAPVHMASPLLAEAPLSLDGPVSAVSPPLPALVAVPVTSVPTFLRADAAAPRLASASAQLSPPVREVPVSTMPSEPALLHEPMTKDMPAFDAPPPRTALPFSPKRHEAPDAPAARRSLPPQSGQTVDLTHLSFSQAAALPGRPIQPPPQTPRDPTATVALDPEIVARILAPTRR